MTREDFLQRIGGSFYFTRVGCQKLQLKPTPFLLLMYYMSEENHCIKSTETIITNLAIQEQAFKKNRKILEEKGLINRETIRIGSRNVSAVSVNFEHIYQIFNCEIVHKKANIAKIDKGENHPHELKKSTSKIDGGENHPHDGGENHPHDGGENHPHELSLTGVKIIPIYIKETSTFKRNNKRNEKETITVKSTLNEKKVNEITPQKIMEMWNSALEGKGLLIPKWKKITKDREKLIKKALESDLKNYGDWLSFFNTIFDSDFLTGKIKQWPFTLEWALKENNLVSILEGKYSRNKPQKTNEFDNPFNLKNKPDIFEASFTHVKNNMEDDINGK